MPSYPWGEGFSTGARLHFQEQSQSSPDRRGGHGDHRYPGRGRGVTFKVSNKVPSFPATPGWGLWLDTRAWPELLSRDTGQRQASQWPLACGLKGSLGQRFQASCLWLGPRSLTVGGESGFKFQVTVSVAPTPEDSEAKLGRAVGGYALGVHRGREAHMCTWVVRG